MYAYLCISMYTYVSIPMYECLCMYVCVCMPMYVCLCVYVYVCMSPYMRPLSVIGAAMHDDDVTYKDI